MVVKAMKVDLISLFFLIFLCLNTSQAVAAAAAATPKQTHQYKSLPKASAPDGRYDMGVQLNPQTHTPA